MCRRAGGLKGKVGSSTLSTVLGYAGEGTMPDPVYGYVRAGMHLTGIILEVAGGKRMR